MRMPEKCRNKNKTNNNNFDNPLTSRRTDGDKKEDLVILKPLYKLYVLYMIYN